MRSRTRTSAFRPHDWLLRRLSSGRIENDQGCAWPADSADWSRVLDLAGRFGILPVVHARCSEASMAVPDPVRQVLRDAYLVNGAKNAQHYRHLGGILRAFHAAGLEVIVLKGTHLAALAYESPALRTMADIDLLLRRRDVARGAGILETLGFRSKVPGVDIDDWCVHAKHLPEYIKPHCPAVELHWTLYPPGSPFQLAAEDLWNRSRAVTLAGESTRVLSAEHLLIHLCTHTAGHACRSHNFARAPFAEGLRPILDIATAVKADRAMLRWSELVSSARGGGADRAVFLGLLLAHDLLAAEVPREVLEELQPADFSESWRQTALDQVAMMASAPSIPEPLRITYARWIDVWHQLSHGSLGERWAGIVGRAFPSRAQMESYMNQLHPEVPMPRRTWVVQCIRVRDKLRSTARLFGHLVLHGREAGRFARLAWNQQVFWGWLTRPGSGKQSGGRSGSNHDVAHEP